jgi:hypothetical protein
MREKEPESRGKEEEKEEGGTPSGVEGEEGEREPEKEEASRALNEFTASVRAAAESAGTLKEKQDLLIGSVDTLIQKFDDLRGAVVLITEAIGRGVIKDEKSLYGALTAFTQQLQGRADLLQSTSEAFAQAVTNFQEFAPGAVEAQKKIADALKKTAEDLPEIYKGLRTIAEAAAAAEISVEERAPHFKREEDNDAELEHWFESHLRNIEAVSETFANNWRMTMPIETFLASIPTDTERGRKLYERLLKKYTAVRTLHDFSYLYKYAAGMQSVQEAAGPLLSFEVIEQNIHDEKVTRTLETLQQLAQAIWHVREEREVQGDARHELIEKLKEERRKREVEEKKEARRTKQKKVDLPETDEEKRLKGEIDELTEPWRVVQAHEEELEKLMFQVMRGEVYVEIPDEAIEVPEEPVKAKIPGGEEGKDTVEIRLVSDIYLDRIKVHSFAGELEENEKATEAEQNPDKKTRLERTKESLLSYAAAQRRAGRLFHALGLAAAYDLTKWTGGDFFLGRDMHLEKWFKFFENTRWKGRAALWRYFDADTFTTLFSGGILLNIADLKWADKEAEFFQKFGLASFKKRERSGRRLCVPIIRDYRKLAQLSLEAIGVQRKSQPAADVFDAASKADKTRGDFLNTGPKNPFDVPNGENYFGLQGDYDHLKGNKGQRFMEGLLRGLVEFHRPLTFVGRLTSWSIWKRVFEGKEAFEKAKGTGLWFRRETYIDPKTKEKKTHIIYRSSQAVNLGLGPDWLVGDVEKLAKDFNTADIIDRNGRERLLRESLGFMAGTKVGRWIKGWWEEAGGAVGIGMGLLAIIWGMIKETLAQIGSAAGVESSGGGAGARRH